MHQDYLMRMVQQFSGFLVRVLRLRQEGKHDEALSVIEDGYGRLAGLPASLVHALSEDDLITLLRAHGRLDPERCLGLAELLREEGHVYDDIERFDESLPRYLKAFRLYLEVLGEDDRLADDRLPGLDDVIAQLSSFDLPREATRRLIDYLVESGRFDEAENVALHHVEAAGNEELEVVVVERFYDDLLRRTDAELIAGGLTRAEVIDGLRRLRVDEDNDVANP